jgi:hypothetical protein
MPLDTCFETLCSWQCCLHVWPNRERGRKNACLWLQVKRNDFRVNVIVIYNLSFTDNDIRLLTK